MFFHNKNQMLKTLIIIIFYNKLTLLCTALSKNQIQMNDYQLNLTHNPNVTIEGLSYCQEHRLSCLGISSVLTVLILCTIIGNAFVIAAVVLDRNLNNVANHLIVSLAVADLMVATMVR
jgi:hypothetical protein